MRALGHYISAQRSLDGELAITFAVDDESILNSLLELKDKSLVIEAKKYSPKRSLDANRYLWVLCDLIAQKLGTTKDEVYLLQLSRYGFWLDKEVHRDAVDDIKTMFRYVEVFDDPLSDESEYVTIRCYLGSSHYSKAEMSRLIDGTVQDAKELGCDTWSPEEVERLIQDWRSR